MAQLDQHTSPKKVPPRFRVRYAFRSDVGQVRTENQDSYGYVRTKYGSIFFVADGMGGMGGGATASTMAVNILARTSYVQDGRINEQSIKDSIDRTHNAIYSVSKTEEALTKMGTTIVALALADGQAIIGHVGDSRVYLCRDKKLQQLTRDHTLVQELVDSGTISRTDAEHHPMAHYLTRSLSPESQAHAEVHCYPFPILTGDIFLLCCDGLYNLVSDDEVAQVLATSDPQTAATTLVDMANERGGTDNITVEVVEVASLISPEDVDYESSDEIEVVISSDYRDGILGETAVKVVEQHIAEHSALLATPLEERKEPEPSPKTEKASNGATEKSSSYTDDVSPKSAVDGLIFGGTNPTKDDVAKHEQRVKRGETKTPEVEKKENAQASPTVDSALEEIPEAKLESDIDDVDLVQVEIEKSRYLMLRNVFIGFVIVAGVAGGYIWYSNQPSLSSGGTSVTSSGSVTPETRTLGSALNTDDAGLQPSSGDSGDVVAPDAEQSQDLAATEGAERSESPDEAAAPAATDVNEKVEELQGSLADGGTQLAADDSDKKQGEIASESDLSGLAATGTLSDLAGPVTPPRGEEAVEIAAPTTTTSTPPDISPKEEAELRTAARVIAEASRLTVPPAPPSAPIDSSASPTDRTPADATQPIDWEHERMLRTETQLVLASKSAVPKGGESGKLFDDTEHQNMMTKKAELRAKIADVDAKIQMLRLSSKEEANRTIETLKITLQENDAATTLATKNLDTAKRRYEIWVNRKLVVEGGEKDAVLKLSNEVATGSVLVKRKRETFEIASLRYADAVELWTENPGDNAAGAKMNQFGRELKAYRANLEQAILTAIDQALEEAMYDIADWGLALSDLQRRREQLNRQIGFLKGFTAPPSTNDSRLESQRKLFDERAGLIADLEKLRTQLSDNEEVELKRSTALKSHTPSPGKSTKGKRNAE